MMIALGSWAMMFGALFFMYLALRAQSAHWPPPGAAELPVLLPGASTAAIVVSSLTLIRALSLLRAGKHRASLGWMAVTGLLGLGFVALQVVLWTGLWRSGITPSTGTVGTVVYGLTVLHAIHVALGLAVLGYLLVVAIRGARGAEQMHRRLVSLRLCGMFWHFVDVVWVLMFVGIFLT
jgi:heme/copper-type cytochrome/quinol oxidase subunit 3